MRRALLLAAAVVLVASAPASAEPGSTTRDGKTLTVSKASGLQAAGEKVRVRGSGYDRSKGIYVAFCVDNGPGKVPTPCGGGADTEGRSGGSVWISDLPPAYGTGLARPYGDGGSFDVEIFVRAALRADDPETEEDETVDCRTTRCAVVTRNDHTRSEDRSQDVLVPVSFGAPSAAAPAAAAPGTQVAAPPAAPVTAKGTAPQEAAPAAPAPAAVVASVPARPTPSGTAAPAAAEPAPAGLSDVQAASAPPAPATDGTGAAPLLLGAGLAAAGAGGALTWRRRRLRA